MGINLVVLYECLLRIHWEVQHGELDLAEEMLQELFTTVYHNMNIHQIEEADSLRKLFLEEIS